MSVIQYLKIIISIIFSNFSIAYKGDKLTATLYWLGNRSSEILNQKINNFQTNF